jgi:ribosomal protein S18 acetylase RimI-like enzyme
MKRPDYRGLTDPSPEPAYRIRAAALPADRVAMLAVLETANMHRVPSPEMGDLDVGRWFVAEDEHGIVGVAGFRLLDQDGEVVGKTTLLAVDPRAREHGIGRALQTLRMRLMREAGASRVVTNADRPETIAWYERHFGYRKVGEVRKLHEFGLRDVDRWTTLEASL